MCLLRLRAWAVHHIIGLLLASYRAWSVTSADCWIGGWTPEVCCSAPGARGNPLCWDHVFTYDRCCSETEEGIQFDLRRRNFVSDMVRRGATVHFDIRHVSSGRTGAVALRALSSRSTVLRVPAAQVYSLKSVPAAVIEVTGRHSCDPHASLALGLAMERVNPASPLTDWIKLLPITFANVLWFSERQLELVRSTFFSYVVQNWFGDLDCMRKSVEDIPANAWRGRKLASEDLRWALSVVKTRGFAFEGTRESTMLIPLADFLNHNMVANVRTATFAEDALRFVSTRNIMPGEELCIDYAQASNLEFMVRYGFRVEDNPYGGRQFDLGGEPMQAHCPSYILRYDIPEIIENTTVDCHRQARYLSFQQQFGTLQMHEQLREDRYIYRAVEEACAQLLAMLETPRHLSEYESSGQADGIVSVLVREIRTERALLQRCVDEFGVRQRDPMPRHIAAELAEPLARLQSDGTPQDPDASRAETVRPPAEGYRAPAYGNPATADGGGGGWPVGGASYESPAAGRPAGSFGTASTAGPLASSLPRDTFAQPSQPAARTGYVSPEWRQPVMDGGNVPPRRSPPSYQAGLSSSAVGVDNRGGSFSPQAGGAQRQSGFANVDDSSASSAFSRTVDQNRIGDLLQRLQQGASIS